jgi:trimethylamine--corrinoid protein Co-methyltransferase
MGGPGHYLGTSATLSRMQSDHCYPTCGNRMSPKEWVEMEKPDLLETATARKETILNAPTAAAIDPVIDRAIREKFNIHLKG